MVVPVVAGGFEARLAACPSGGEIRSQTNFEKGTARIC